MLRELHDELGIPVDYGREGGPPRYDEAVDLVDVGPNLVGRMQRLTPEAAEQWQAMVAAAADDGVTLLIVSVFRSDEYQAVFGCHLMCDINDESDEDDFIRCLNDCEDSLVACFFDEGCYHDIPALFEFMGTEEFGNFLKSVEQGCRSHGIEYQQIRTDQPLDVALSKYLASRMAKIK